MYRPGPVYRPTPSNCEEVSWSESSQTTSTQDSIDSLQWSTDSIGCNLFQDETALHASDPFTNCADSNLQLITPVGNCSNAATFELENPISTFGTVVDFQTAYSPDVLGPTLSPLKTSKKMLSYKVILV